MIKRSDGVIFVYAIVVIWVSICVVLIIGEVVHLQQLLNLPKDAFNEQFGDELIWESKHTIIAICLFMLPPIAIVFVVWWSERRRQRVMKGTFAARYLAVQPKSDAEALPLPTKIDLYWTQWPLLLLFFEAHFLLYGLWFLIVLVFCGGNFLITLPFIVALEVGLLVLFVRMSSLIGHQRIEVTNEGLSKCFMGRWRRTVQWKDARLFALVAGNESTTAGILALTYELASNTESVRWSEIGEIGLHRLLPTISLEDYNRQVEALASLVAAKTGLPLYDLRTK